MEGLGMIVNGEQGTGANMDAKERAEFDQWRASLLQEIGERDAVLVVLWQNHKLLQRIEALNKIEADSALKRAGDLRALKDQEGKPE
jgi:hypothetical protein